MKKSIQKLMDHSIPFTVLSLPNQVELRQYWTKGGMYGTQVVTVVFDYPNDVWDHKTAGCGYCKQSQGLMMAFEHLGYKPKNHIDNGKLSYDYYVGGNFYKCDEVEAI